MSESEGSDDIILQTLWGRVLEAWDDDKAHNALLDYALRAELLPEVAGHYRALKDDAEKGERAKKRIDAIVIAATQMMLAQKTPPILVHIDKLDIHKCVLLERMTPEDCMQSHWELLRRIKA